MISIVIISILKFFILTLFCIVQWHRVSLKDFFLRAYGPDVNSRRFREAHDAFVRSNAAYSIVSFVFQIKDRHNANVLLTSHGQICHIDFGFVLSHTVAFEKAPFKITEELIDVMSMVSQAIVPDEEAATLKRQDSVSSPSAVYGVELNDNAHRNEDEQHGQNQDDGGDKEQFHQAQEGTSRNGSLAGFALFCALVRNIDFYFCFLFLLFIFKFSLCEFQ